MNRLNTSRPLACSCGGTLFDQVQRARLSYDVLAKRGQEQLDVAPVLTFRCSACGVELDARKRLDELRAPPS